MATDRELLWDPTPGMLVSFPSSIFPGLMNVHKVVRVFEYQQPIAGRFAVKGFKAIPSVEYISVKGLMPGSTPRWERQEADGCNDHMSLLQWRRRVPKFTILPADWQLPAAKPREFKIILNADELTTLAESIQALAGRIPEEEFAALVAAARPMLKCLDGK